MSQLWPIRPSLMCFTVRTHLPLVYFISSTCKIQVKCPYYKCYLITSKSLPYVWVAIECTPLNWHYRPECLAFATLFEELRESSPVSRNESITSVYRLAVDDQSWPSNAVDMSFHTMMIPLPNEAIDTLANPVLLPVTARIDRSTWAPLIA